MKTYLDIGSNDLEGFSLLQTSEEIYDDVLKIFVEPNPECWSLLDTYMTYLKNAFLIKKAVDIDVKKATLLTRSDKNQDVAATIMGEKFLTDSLGKYNIKVDKYNKYDIETTTILNIIDEFKINTKDCVLKIDAEGVEYAVLNQILENNIIFKKIYCEFHVLNNEDEINKQDIISKLKNRNQSIIEWH